MPSHTDISTNLQFPFGQGHQCFLEALESQPLFKQKCRGFLHLLNNSVRGGSGDGDSLRYLQTSMLEETSIPSLFDIMGLRKEVNAQIKMHYYLGAMGTVKR